MRGSSADLWVGGGPSSSSEGDPDMGLPLLPRSPRHPEGMAMAGVYVGVTPTSSPLYSWLKRPFSRLISTLGLNMASPRRHCSPENEMEGQEWTGAWVGGQPAASLFTALSGCKDISTPLSYSHFVTLGYHLSSKCPRCCIFLNCSFCERCICQSCNQNGTSGEVFAQFFWSLERI